MKNAISAFTVDWIRHAGKGTVFVSAMFIVGPWLFYKFFLKSTGIDILQDAESGHSSGFNYYYTYFGMAIVNSGATAMMMAVQLAQRNRMQPVSTGLLASWNLLSIAATAAVFNLLTQGGYRLAFAVPWPIMNTTIAMSTMVIVLASTGVWLRDCRLHRFVPAALWVIGWNYWCLRALHGGDFSQQISGAILWTVADVAMFAVAWVVSWVLMKSGIAHHRRGAELDGRLLQLLTDPGSLLERRPSTGLALPFSDSRQAFLQMDWQRNRVRTYVSTFAFSVLFGMVFCSMACSDLQVMNSLPPIMLFAAVSQGLLAGVFSAGDARSLVTREMATFLSTLPVSDRELGRRFSVGLFKLTVFVCVAILATVAVAFLFGLVYSPNERFFETLTQLSVVEILGSSALILVPLACLVLTWVGCGLGASFALTPNVVVATIAVGLLCLWSLLTAAAAANVPGTHIIALVVLFIFAVLVCGGGTLALTARACRRNLITNRQANLSVLLGLTVCVSVWMLLPLGWYGKSVAAGFSLIVVLPFASVPINLARCRHA